MSPMTKGEQFIDFFVYLLFIEKLKTLFIENISNFYGNMYHCKGLYNCEYITLSLVFLSLLENIPFST